MWNRITPLENGYTDEQLRFGRSYPNMFAIRLGVHARYDRLKKKHLISPYPSSLESGSGYPVISAMESRKTEY